MKLVSKLLQGKPEKVSAKGGISGARMPILCSSDPQLSITAESLRLNALRSLQIMDTAPEPCFDTLTRMAASLMQTEIASISFMDETRVWAKSIVGEKFREFPRHNSYTERLITDGRPLYILDIEDAAYSGGTKANQDHSELYTALGLRFFAGVPIFSADKQVVGALSVRGRQPRDRVSVQQIGMMERMAQLVTDQLELRKLRSSSERASLNSGTTDVGTTANEDLSHASSTQHWPRPRDIRGALAAHQLVMYYQPEVELETGRIIGLEALVRWQHPERGLIQPMDFIPEAERCGLILPIGDWGMNEVCRQIRAWQQYSPELRNLRVCVNLSARQFARAGLIDHVEALLLQNGLSGGQLGLEMTETSLTANTNETAALLLNLQRLGVSLHLDDFGTGYSSLSQLHQFPFDVLKIDRSFVNRMPTGIQAARIVQTIVELAQVLHMDVVAEGIETDQQLRILRNMGCRYGQGFLFSRPLPVDQIGRLLNAFEPKSPRLSRCASR